MNILKRSLLLFVLFSISPIVLSAKLDSILIKNKPGETTILCAVTGTIVQKSFVLSNPTRVVIDFSQTSTALDVKNINFSHELIEKIRSGRPNANTLRLVFDVKRHVTLRTSTWQPSDSRQHGLRIDLKAGKAPSIIKPIVQVKTPAAQPIYTPLAKSAQPVRAVPANRLRDVVVVLDPGHGGKDPGATGVRRSQEKHIVLNIALKLKQLIDKQPGMRAVLTRNGDYYVGLRDRMSIARKYNGDIFVAIHADAFGNHNSNGASVFALSQMGATSEAARWLAEKENYSELGGVNLSRLDDQNGVIRTVLIDLSQTATIGASLQMGGKVLRELGTMTTLHSAKVEQARFMVLKSPDMPSVLIETGFISNPREEMNLTNPAYQTRLSHAIFRGIKNYFWDYPPHGTRVEAMSNVNRRIVHNNEDALPGTPISQRHA